MPENTDAWDVFTSAATCWKATMGGVTGMDYPSVRAVADAVGVEWTEDLLSRIRVLEAHHLEYLNRK